MGKTEGRVTRPDASSEEIRRDISNTRQEMDHTLDELGERLHPRNLLDDLIGLFRSGSGDASHQTAATLKSLGRSVKRNPGPALLVGAGVAWALVSAASDDEEETLDQRYRYRLEGADPGVYPYQHSSDRLWEPGASDEYAGSSAGAGERIKDASSEVQEKAGDAARAVADSARRGAEAIGEKWDEAKQAIRGRASSASQGAGYYGRQGRYRASHALGYSQERFHEAQQEYPLLLGAGFLALGLVTGIALPHTRQEDRWMGDASDQLTDQAKELGHEAMEQGKEMAAAAAAGAKSEAEKQGLTPDQLGPKVRRAASRIGQSASDAVREEGLDPKSLKAKAESVGREAQKNVNEG